MAYIVVDCESDGQIIGDNSMVCFGAVVVEPSLSKTFYGKTRPISDIWVPEALAISGFSREEHLTFDDPAKVMKEFADWIKEVSVGQPVLISDNNGYDASWINYYFWKFYGNNPFGWSSRRIGDLYCGMQKDARANWKHLRKTNHSHMPVDDAMGNAEALLAMQKMGLKIKFV
jgi:hypothetical protein